MQDARLVFNKKKMRQKIIMILEIIVMMIIDNDEIS